MTSHNVSVYPSTCRAIVEFKCHYLLIPVIIADSSNKINASIFHTQPSPKQSDWLEAYTKDSCTHLMLNHAQTCTTPHSPEFINSAHKCYRAHLREKHIKLLDDKLEFYVPIRSDDRFVMLMIVPQDLRRVIFDAYHASGVGGQLCVNKTLVVLRLRFLWPDIRKDIIAWVRACAVCIQAKSTTFTSR